ncbi:MAG TPA: hypothetical protein VIG64_05090 [Actinomycetota bacterium]
MDRRLYAQLRTLDRHDLRRVAIFVGGLLTAAGDGEASAGWVTGEQPGSVTYRRESVRCGKRGCTRCPHGPYWYAYYREDGRLKSRYIGRDLAQETGSAD